MPGVSLLDFRIEPNATVPGVLVAGLTGGVGSGKSTVATALARRGAVVIDTDVLARDVVKPGTPGLTAVVERFGSGYLTPQGSLNREGLARLVFADEQDLSDLNAIVHPLVRREAQSLVAVHEDTDALVLLVVPLLIETGQYQTQFLIVVDCDDEVAVQRVTRQRGWTEDEVRRRMAMQVGRDERRVAADYVIENSGSLQALKVQVDEVWRILEARRE